MKDVSIIIVNYNTLQLVVECVNSVIELTSGLDYEIIVIDNNSDSELGEKLNHLFPINIRTIGLTENVGFGRANNEGFKVANGKYVICLNPDTILLNNAIKILHDFMETHPNVGVCGGNLYDVDMKPTHSYRMMLPSVLWEIDSHFGGFYAKCRWGVNVEFNHTAKPLNVGYITGADMMIRKEIIDSVGGFSEYFFMYYEECELTFRIKRLGFSCYSVPAAHIQHLEGESFQSSELTKKDKYKIYSHWMYRRLCFPPIVYMVLRIIELNKLKLPKSNNQYSEYVIEVIKEIDKLAL